MRLSEKLVRDGYEGIIDPSRLRIASERDFLTFLRQKFVEELIEARKAKTREEKLEEVADLREVYLALAEIGDEMREYDLTYFLIRGISRLYDEEIEAVRAAKFAKLGGFSKRLILRLTDERAGK